jgi:hypothetical protein
MLIPFKKAGPDQPVHRVISGASRLAVKNTTHIIVGWQVTVHAVMIPEFLELGFVSHKFVG